MSEEWNSYMREYMKKPEAKLKQKIRYRKWYDKNKQKILNNPNRKEYQLKWRKSNYTKRSAHWIVARAVKAGIIIPPKKCSVCENICVIHAHHMDYSKPLEVKWVCASCHKKLHIALLVT
jgi:hypothetical protein